MLIFDRTKKHKHRTQQGATIIIIIVIIIIIRGGGTPSYKLYRYLPPHRVGFLHGFGLKTGIHFPYYGLELGTVFQGTTGVYERIYRFNSK